MNVLFILLLVVHQCLGALDPIDLKEFFEHSGAPGTQHGKDESDKDFFTSNSYVPHLPTISGFMGTHGTYRFLTIHEQTAILIGDGKHGIWRIQENGHIREYRKKGKKGIPWDVDPNALGNDAEKRVMYTTRIMENYASYIPEERWAGYKYPDQRISDGKADNMTGYLNFIDLPIYHTKYGGKYDNHVPIDLPHFYCTMTRDDYKHMHNVWKYAVAQPLANQMGPLAIRAGMDIKELYFNVLRFDFMADAGVWSNVGSGDEATDKTVKNLDELKARYQTVNYRRLDFSKMDVEAYLYERPFFNVPYIFITLVINNKELPDEFSYIRPNGAYWEGLLSRQINFTNTVVKHYPKAYVEDYPLEGNSTLKTVYGLPVYGQHHPRRAKHGHTGGACPARGGDWGRYPWSNSGAGYPTNYQEITPMCDGFVVDMKMWMNLDEPTWNKINLFQGNSGFDGKVKIDYTADVNVYGKYTDEYLIQNNAVNPYFMDLTKDGKIVEASLEPKPKLVSFSINFTRSGEYLDFVNVTGLITDKKDEEDKGEEDEVSSDNQITNNISLCVLAVIFTIGLFVRDDIL